ncbi:hypothetical protein R3P38DRAFT_3070409 [Favolaschia claudopus]|uniref:Transmembrane protein n=1 Tax=Favolaschia claudopus TaxID=2862362 RepID=A0AAW0A0E4_9AGAR
MASCPAGHLGGAACLIKERLLLSTSFRPPYITYALVFLTRFCFLRHRRFGLRKGDCFRISLFLPSSLTLFSLPCLFQLRRPAMVRSS